MPVGEQHLFELGQKRERWTILRWLTVHAHWFFPQVGIKGCWFCGVNLLKSQVFGDTLNGDIDIIVGHLSFDLDHDDWLARIEAERKQLPADTHESHLVGAALERVVVEGRLLWPPIVQPLAASEVKVSWFSPEDAIWKNSHTGEAPSIKGQVEALRQRGFNSVSFVHLGVTRPRNVYGVNPWFQAMADAQDAHAGLPVLFDPAEIPWCGYFTAVTGAVGHKTEDRAGAGGRPLMRQTPEFQEVEENGTWRLRLQRQLATIPPPNDYKVFVLACENCEAWFAISHGLDSIACPQCHHLWGDAHG